MCHDEIKTRSRVRRQLNCRYQLSLTGVSASLRRLFAGDGDFECYRDITQAAAMQAVHLGSQFRKRPFGRPLPIRRESIKRGYQRCCGTRPR